MKGNARAGRGDSRLRERAALASRFRIALVHSPVVVFNQDKALRYTWINSPVLCWAATEPIGRTDMDIVGGAEGERLTAIKQAVLESGVGARLEVPVTFNAETHYFDLTIDPLRDDVGAIEGIAGACTDITEIKRTAAEWERLTEELANTHRELVKRNLELEVLHKGKTEWLGMAAHDLRNPLSAILLNCEVLTAESAGMSREQMAVLRTIHSSGQSMLELLDELLDISAIETGNQGFFPEPTDLRSLIEASIALSRPLANRKGTDIKAQYPERIPTLTLDWRKMTQVFINLIGNSIKFCQNGGLVEVTVVLEPAHFVFHVRDNGPGISPDELESIFMPFQRGRGSASAQPGTGLGLAICKRIVERHGGRIWAENAVGGGAVLYLSLPLRGLGNGERRLSETDD